MEKLITVAAKDFRKYFFVKYEIFYTLESKWRPLRWIEPSKEKSILCKCVNVNPNYRTSHESLMNRGFVGGDRWNDVKLFWQIREGHFKKSHTTVLLFWTTNVTVAMETKLTLRRDVGNDMMLMKWRWQWFCEDNCFYQKEEIGTSKS